MKSREQMILRFPLDKSVMDSYIKGAEIQAEQTEVL